MQAYVNPTFKMRLVGDLAAPPAAARCKRPGRTCNVARSKPLGVWISICASLSLSLTFCTPLPRAVPAASDGKATPPPADPCWIQPRGSVTCRVPQSGARGLQSTTSGRLHCTGTEIPFHHHASHKQMPPFRWLSPPGLQPTRATVPEHGCVDWIGVRPANHRFCLINIPE